VTVEIGIDPVITQLGPLPLTWHGLFTALAIVAALTFGMRRARRSGVSEDAVWSLMLWACAGGIAGARAFYLLDHPSLIRENPAGIFAVWEGGIAVYGALIGGIAAGYVRARQLRLEPWTLLDAAAPAILLGQAIGRIGCLINGDAWGGPVGCPCSVGPAGCPCGWGLVYTNPNALIPASLLGVPTHPYPVYEIVWDLALMGVVLLLGTRQLKTGTLFLVATIGYAVGRFSLSLVRQESVVVAGLQEAQVIAVITGTIALIVLIARRRPWDRGQNRPGAAAPPTRSRGRSAPV
jgi:phosphatidylglycerol:prolipoprotein diacylglycerol transferase